MVKTKTWMAGSLLLVILGLPLEQARGGGNLETVVEGGTAISKVRWFDSAIPIAWRLNSDGAIDNTNNGNSSVVSTSQVKVALESAFNRWRDLGCSRIDFTYGGLTETGEVGLDGENVVTWRDPGADGAEFLAVTAVFALTEELVVSNANRDLNSDGNDDLDPALYPNGTVLPAGTIVDADISFNSDRFDWVTTPVGGLTIFDIQAVAAHEQGHMIGLSHSTMVSPNATMFPFAYTSAAAQLDQRSLEADDAASAGRLYPSSCFSTSFAAIAGRVILEPGGPTGADGVSVMAINARTLEPVVEVFSTSRFDSSDRAPGSFVIDGLPPGDYVVAAQYFDGTDERQVWTNRYNYTIALSNVANGNAVATDGVGLGFAPRPEFWNAGESTADDMTDPAVMTLGEGSEYGGVNLTVNTSNPVPPTGSVSLNLPRDGFSNVAFSAGFVFSFFGVDYTRAYVGANGYITFGAGDTDASESRADFLGPEPRIAALFDALNPGVPNPVDVYVKNLSDRVEITYLGIPEATNSPSNTFRVSLFRTGDILIDYDFCRARDAIVGITPGGASPAAQDVDFSRTPSFHGAPNAAILEEFRGPSASPSHSFDLWGGRLRFRPRPDGGYNATFEAPGSRGSVGISSVMPDFGPEAGGTAITIRGFGFTTTADTTVLLGGNAATSFNVVEGGVITAVTPAGMGRVGVTVTNSHGTDTLPGAFTYYAPPQLTGVDPGSGPRRGGTFVTLTGVNFTTTDDTRVLFGTRPLAEMRVTSGGTITGFTPEGTGAVDVNVTNRNGSATLHGGFAYLPPPTVTSVTPNNGPQGGGTPVTVAGTGFTSTADTVVKFGSRFATNVGVVSATLLTCRTPSGAGVVTVEVSNTNGTGSKASAFTYNPPPELASVTPNSGAESGGTSVTLHGAHFTTSADTMVFFGSGAATNVVVLNPNDITCTTPTGTGTVGVRVSNGNGTALLENGFTYRPAPRCEALAPSFGSESGGTVVTITGGNFFGGAETRVLFGSSLATAVTVVDLNHVRCASPAGTGTVNVTVQNLFGSCTLTNSFRYGIPPEILCRYGNVNETVGAITPVIFANGSIGDESRTVHFGRDQVVTLDVEAPPANLSGTAQFVIYVWAACPTPDSISHLPFRLGDLCLPCPLSADRSPQPVAIFNNFGYQRALGRATLPSSPAPTRLSVGRLRRDMFVQGLIVDDSSPRGVSVTNGIKLDRE